MKVAAMIPLLSLGIPGSATTAVLIGAFMIHNLQPGPMLFVREPELVYGLFASMTVVNVVIIALSFIMVRLFARLALLPYPVLATGILSVCVIGSLAYGNVDAAMLMLAFACIGLALEAAGYPLAPVILGLVLAPIIEISFRRAMIMESFDVVAVLTQPLAAAILLLATAFLLGPWAMRAAAALRGSRSTAADAAPKHGE